MATPVTAPPPNPIAPKTPSTVNPTANGIQWTAPPPQAPPEIPSDTFGQIAEAMSQAPLNYQKQQSDLAQSSALQEQAKAAAIAADDQILQRVIPTLKANPELAHSPALLAQLTPILARRGLQVPRDPVTGQVDAAHLIAMITPTPTMNWQEQDALYKGLDMKEKQMGIGGYTPALFLADVRRARAQLSSAGMSTAPVDSYLTEDGTQLNPAIVANYVGPKTEAQMDQMRKLGIHIEDEDALRAALNKEKTREFDTTMQYKYAALSVRERQVNNQMQVAQQRLQVAYGNLNARWASIQDAHDRFGQAQTRLNLDLLKTRLQTADSTFQHAQSELDADRRIVDTIVATPGYRDQPQLMTQLTQLNNEMFTLKTQLDTVGPKLIEEKNVAAQGIANISTNITGSPSHTQFGVAGTDVPGNPGFKFTGVSRVVNGAKQYQMKNADGETKAYTP